MDVLADNSIDFLFYNSCEEGDTVFVEKIINFFPNEIKKYINMSECLEIEQACINGNLHILRTIIPQFIHHRHFNKHINSGFIDACMNGHLDIVRYLNDHCPQQINFSGTEAQNTFNNICKYGKIDIIKYLLYQSRQSHIIDSYKNEGFIHACSSENTEVINFFVIEYELKINNSILEYLSRTNKNDIISLFEKTKFKIFLKNSLLQHSNLNNKKIKI